MRRGIGRFLFYDGLTLTLELARSLVVYGVHWLKGLGTAATAALLRTTATATATAAATTTPNATTARVGTGLMGTVRAAAAAVAAASRRLDCEEVRQVMDQAVELCLDFATMLHCRDVQVCPRTHCVVNPTPPAFHVSSSHLRPTGVAEGGGVFVYPRQRAADSQLAHHGTSPRRP